ncbi:hypothetical protein NKH77_36560 [Streptomyces sp. M19]
MTRERRTRCGPPHDTGSARRRRRRPRGDGGPGRQPAATADGKRPGTERFQECRGVTVDQDAP